MFNGEVNATSGKFTGEVNATKGKFEGYLYTNNVPFIIVAMCNFRIQDMNSDTGYFSRYKTANIKSFKRREKGTYDVLFLNPIKTKIFKAMGSDNIQHNYLTLMFLGNAHDSRESFAYNCFITTVYDLISIDNINNSIVSVDESTMTALVYGSTLYVSDNNHDDLIDFITLQGFFVGTEPN